MATTETKSITDAQIRTLRTEARAAGDAVQAHACSVALGDEEPVTDGNAWEDRYGGGGFSRVEARGMMAVKSADQAREMCAKAIRAAAAQG